MSADTRLISVVIPTYNRARYVTKAIESVLAQTFTDYEILVIDDGSTDNTRAVLHPYLSKIIYIYQENRGVSAARNTGIRAAKGEWIAFLDSDDEWLPCKLELQVKDVRQYPDAVLSCSNISFESQAGLPPVDYFNTCLSLPERVKTEFIQEPLFKPYAWTSTVLARRNKIFAVGLFDEELTIHEDTDLFYRLALIGGFVVNHAVLAKAFRRDEALDINLSAQALNDRVKNHTSLISIFKKLFNDQLTATQRLFVQEKYSSSWFDLALVYYSMANYSQARRCFLISFQAKPSLKNMFKLFLGFSGSLGIKLIENRRKIKKGFRRSEYY